MLPVKCQQCGNVISIDEVLASPEENSKYTPLSTPKETPEILP